MQKTVKFGGSSLACAERFANVKHIIELDKSRSAIVVSAPGKSPIEKIKVTDMLIAYSAEPDNEKKQAIINRYSQICNEIKVNIPSNIEEVLSNPSDYAFTVSRGEYLGAKIMAEYLGATFVDAADVVIFDKDGKLKKEETYKRIKSAFEKSNGMIVVPGFFGSKENKQTVLMERGGSDVTGAIVAAALESDVYENWTDVNGMLSADPRIIENPKAIPHLSFPDLASLTKLGASVLHPDAVLPVREKSIPINIRSTFEITAGGTMIRGEEKSPYAVGVTSKRGFVPSENEEKLVFESDDVTSVSLVGNVEQFIPELTNQLKNLGLIKLYRNSMGVIFTFPSDKEKEALKKVYEIVFE